MQSKIRVVLGSAALLACLGQAPAATITRPPAWSPMVMFGLDVAWKDPGDHSLGQIVTIDGRMSTSDAPDTPATARNLKDVGWPLEGGGTFNAGDVFGSPYASLNGTSFGRSFGWYSSPDLPPGQVWRVVLIDHTPGLKVYDPYSTDFNEIFTSADEDTLTYNGNSAHAVYDLPDLVNGLPEYTEQMFHPVFAVPAQTGPVFAVFAIHLATADGLDVADVAPGYERFNFTAAATVVLGDSNRNGVVDQADYTIWYNHYGMPGSWGDGDFTFDGIVDQADYTVWYNHYGATGGAVPEPLTVAVLSAGGMALAARRKIRAIA